MMLKFALIAAQIGFIICNPRCTYNSDCARYDCDSEIPFCDHGSCGCIDSCKEGDCLKFLKSCPTYDSSMNHHYQQYCPHNRCSCPTPTTIATTTTTKATTQPPLAPGTCMDKPDCYSYLQSCLSSNVHCIDKKCMCLDTIATTTTKPGCSYAIDCAPLLTSCPMSQTHCLDSKCVCLRPPTTTTTTMAPTTTPTPPCQSYTDCTGSCIVGSLHCVDNTCMCLS